MENPVYLVIQGASKESTEEIYQQYLRGVAPLMKEFGAEVIAVGTGFESEFTHQTFPLNAVLRLPNETALTNFPGDPRYAAIKKYRDAAYKALHLSVFQRNLFAIRKSVSSMMNNDLLVSEKSI